MNKHNKGYLAHPFDTRYWVREWELQFEEVTGIELVNPFYDIERTDVVDIDEGRVGRYEKLNACELVERDVAAIVSCEFVVAYVTGDLSYGTIMEIVYADRFGVPVYIICTNGQEKHPWLIYHATKVFTTQQDFRLYITGMIQECDT